MKKIIPLKTIGGIIYAEVDVDTDDSDSIVLASKSDVDTAVGSFDAIINAIKQDAQHLKDSVDGLAPNEVEISIGIKAGVKGGTTIFFLSEVSGEASYTVKMKWTKEKMNGG